MSQPILLHKFRQEPNFAGAVGCQDSLTHCALCCVTISIHTYE